MTDDIFLCRSELECLSALSRLHQHPASDLTYYQDALAAEGAPKALSVVLSLFSASTRICLEAVKVVSLLCQHSDNRSSLHADNTEGLGGHGACYSGDCHTTSALSEQPLMLLCVVNVQ